MSSFGANFFFGVNRHIQNSVVEPIVGIRYFLFDHRHTSESNRRDAHGRAQ